MIGILLDPPDPKLTPIRERDEEANRILPGAEGLPGWVGDRDRPRRERMNTGPGVPFA